MFTQTEITPITMAMLGAGMTLRGTDMQALLPVPSRRGSL